MDEKKKAKAINFDVTLAHRVIILFDCFIYRKSPL